MGYAKSIGRSKLVYCPRAGRTSGCSVGFKSGSAGEKCSDCKTVHKKRRRTDLNTPTLMKLTEEDFTVEQSFDMFDVGTISTPEEYCDQAKKNAARLQKNEFFSGYMKVEVPSTIWNPLPANVRNKQNNLDKRYCPGCKSYFSFSRNGSMYLKKCHGQLLRHPYYVWNLFNKKKPEDNTKYEASWLHDTRGDMHNSWGHQAFMNQIGELAKVCGFPLSLKDQEALVVQ